MLHPNEEEELAQIARLRLLMAIQERLERGDTQAADDVRAALKGWSPDSDYQDLLRRIFKLGSKV
jgi:hypothetical protein